MPREFPWFKMRSAKQQKKFEASYKSRMFVLGEEFQKQKELELMRSVVDTKLRDMDILFHLLCIKEALFQEEADDIADDLAWWFVNKPARELTRDERILFISAAKLLASIKTEEQFPKKEDVISNTESILAQYPFLNNLK